MRPPEVIRKKLERRELSSSFSEFLDDDERNSTLVGSVSSKEASFEFLVVICYFGTTTTPPSLKSLSKPRISLGSSCGGAQTYEKHHNCSRPISHPSTIEEACKLVEASFEYVCDGSEAKIFRKPK